MKSIGLKSSNYSFILKDHVFCDVFNMFIHIALLNNTQLSLFLNIPIEQVQEIRSDKTFGMVNKALCCKLDILFDTNNGFFYSIFKKTLIVK
jgi:hypothetical protein